MNAVIYARYSSEKQNEKSIEGQLRECKEFAQRKGVDIVDTYIDRATTAKTDNRPSFQKMISDSETGKFEIIIVWKLDRFARNRYDSAIYKKKLKDNGISLISATENISDTPEGILLEALIEGYAEFYSSELAVKVTRGMTENALEGKFNGGGLPIGITVDENRHLKPDEVVAPLVLKSFKMYAEGHSMREIADMLNSAGVRTSKGTEISFNTVTRMLHNRKYLGEYKFNEIVIENAFTPIVPKELFDTVQSKLAIVKKTAARSKAKEEYLLTTKLFCGHCQRYMIGESGTSKTGTIHRYYKCAGAKKRLGCDKKAVKKDWIENVVINIIRQSILTDEIIEQLADCVSKAQEKDNVVLISLEKSLKETKKAISNLINAIEQGMCFPSTKERLAELENRKSELESEIKKESILNPKFSKNEFIFFFERYRHLDLSVTENRQRLVDIFLNSVYLFDDGIGITLNFKKGTRQYTFAEIEASGLCSNINGIGSPKKHLRKQVLFCVCVRRTQLRLQVYLQHH